MYVLGFDIGGTKSAVVLANIEDTQVSFLGRYERKTVPDWKKVLNELEENGRKIAKEHGISIGSNEGVERIGISCGGPLSSDRRQILSPPNLPGWDRVPVIDYLEKKMGIPARLENDADAGALAEWRFGAGQGCRNMIFLTFGTGLGAGLILDGRLYRGASGLAGEAGHIRMEKDGPVGYQKSGSLEGFCSGGGIARMAEIEGIKASAKELAAMAEMGDEKALKIFERSGAIFGRGLAVLIDLLNPERIIAGSVYARSHHFLDSAMYRELKKEALAPSLAACRILPAALGERIGDYAAISAALE